METGFKDGKMKNTKIKERKWKKVLKILGIKLNTKEQRRSVGDAECHLKGWQFQQTNKFKIYLKVEWPQIVRYA